MQIMNDSLHSTGMSQATNNWIEDLNFENLGEIGFNLTIADQ
ncbi:MAG: hypothetical protein ACK5LC_03885 [Coprobacillaceae bacterium]